ncbi:MULTISPECIES: shikimate kinase [unclassified Luteimonas]
MNPARHLVLVGPMGAGKTSIGRCLARHFDLAFADSDQEIEQRTGATVATIFECEGEAGFRARERDVLAALLAGPDAVISTGGGAVLDEGSRRCLARDGFVVHLHADVPAQLQRLARDRSRPLLAHGDRASILARLATERDPLYAEVADLVFEPAPAPAQDAAQRLAALLESTWRRGTAAAATRATPEPAA